MKFKLSKPIAANGEQVSELEMREPKGGDFIDLGMPMSFSADGSTELKMKTIAQYVSRLAGIPPSSVAEIHPKDLMLLAIEVAAFFGEPESGAVLSPEA
jgi:hypothetical protein